ncbi:OzmP [Streptomyces sp. NPDC050658]|uniref:OzmP n=1 Tax=unclassified Streptomyces TaxID=2593676 RepID=UPI0034247D26
MTYCRICTLAADHPGISLDADEICNLCRLDIAAEVLANAQYATEVYDEFAASGPSPHGQYDMLLMYSGGKDSTYLLDKYVNEHGKRVLAYTFEVPFESHHAAANIDRARARIAATFVSDRDDVGITTMMREVFNRPSDTGPGRYLDEKLPCISCRNFWIIRAIKVAVRHRIPYLIQCADPQQLLTEEPRVRTIVRDFHKTFGAALASEIFGDDLETLLFADDDELPKIVYPFIASSHRYDSDAIAAELRAKGLYESSPIETHCTLFPLLNYYSLTRWGCMFYKLNAASHLRAVHHSGQAARNTFSIQFPRAADLPSIERRLKEITVDLAHGHGDPAQHEQDLVQLFLRLDAPEPAARFVAASFLDLRRTADVMGINLG